MAWSYEQKRRLIEIARSTNDLEEAAMRMGLKVSSTKSLSKQLDVSFKSRPHPKPRIKKQ
jgi:hypothetical protein